jgi:hypothetical protein
MRRQTALIDHCPSPTEFRDYWKRNYGPTIAADRFNEGNPDRHAQLDREFLAFLDRWNQSTEPDRTAYASEYLLVTAVKRRREGISRLPGCELAWGTTNYVQTTQSVA